MAKGRKSIGMKTDIVLQHLRGESLETLSRKHNVSVNELALWTETFKAAGKQSLKSNSKSFESYELEQAKRVIAEQAISIDILKKRNQLIDKLNKK